MTPQENKTFFREFGARLAALRKESGVTQVQLAEALGYSQQQVQSFEKGRRRIPLSALPVVLETLGITFEQLMGTGRRTSKPQKRGPPSKIEVQLQEISRLPRAEQRFVAKMLDSVLQRSGV